MFDLTSSPGQQRKALLSRPPAILPPRSPIENDFEFASCQILPPEADAEPVGAPLARQRRDPDSAAERRSI